jgi:CRP/FNR family transcriptional regulator
MGEPISFDKTGRTKPLLDLETLKTRCANCSLRELCLPVGLVQKDMERLDQIIRKRRRVEKGDLLYRQDSPFTRLYAVRLGHFKTYQVNPGWGSAYYWLPNGGRNTGIGRH